MDHREQVNTNKAIVQEYITQRKVQGLHIKSVDNFSWITGGVKNYVTFNGIQQECGLLITPDKAYVVTPYSELNRLKPLIPTDTFEFIVHNWDEDPDDIIRKKIGTGTVLSDTEKETVAFLKSQRVCLNENEQKHLRFLGKNAAEALERGLDNITADMTEQEAAATVTYELMIRGIEPELVIIAGENNFRSHHNIAGEGRVGTICMGIICAKWNGLVVSLTRMIAFEENPDLLRQMENNTAIDAEIIDATTASTTLGDAFGKLIAIYKKYGLGEEVWGQLHQGGVVGYKLKEYFASEKSAIPIREGMAFSWNITIPGTKSEDTYLYCNDEMQWMTQCDDSLWPVVTHEINGKAYSRPGIRIKSLSE